MVFRSDQLPQIRSVAPNHKDVVGRRAVDHGPPIWRPCSASGSRHLPCDAPSLPEPANPTDSVGRFLLSRRGRRTRPERYREAKDSATVLETGQSLLPLSPTCAMPCCRQKEEIEPAAVCSDKVFQVAIVGDLVRVRDVRWRQRATQIPDRNGEANGNNGRNKKPPPPEFPHPAARRTSRNASPCVTSWICVSGSATALMRHSGSLRLTSPLLGSFGRPSSPTFPESSPRPPP